MCPAPYPGSGTMVLFLKLASAVGLCWSFVEGHVLPPWAMDAVVPDWTPDGIATKVNVALLRHSLWTECSNSVGGDRQWANNLARTNHFGLSEYVRVSLPRATQRPKQTKTNGALP